MTLNSLWAVLAPAGLRRCAPWSKCWRICRTEHVESARRAIYENGHPNGWPFSYMARLARFERATAWFVARYSIKLSYWRVEGAYYREEVV